MELKEMCKNLKGYLIIYVTLHRIYSYTSIYMKKYFEFLSFYRKLSKFIRDSIQMVPISKRSLILLTLDIRSIKYFIPPLSFCILFCRVIYQRVLARKPIEEKALSLLKDFLLMLSFQ